MAFVSEEQLVVRFLVVEKFLELCGHLPTISADQDVRVT
jgi:hypothetical protein